VPEIRLTGCRSRPLIGYLKGLGVLGVTSRQADPSACGRWRSDVFELQSNLDSEGILRFLLDDYAPAPVVSPWNGGSGFHPNDRKDAIEALEASSDERFESYRATIAAAHGALARLGIDDKPAKTEKLPLIRQLRRSLPDEALPWLDTAIVVTGEDVGYPPLLGSGGNDGRFDFSNNYAQAIVLCLLGHGNDNSAKSLSAALQGDSVPLQRKLSLGHFSRDASPTNSPLGESDSLGNPWDLILAVEGALLLAAGAARRHGASTRGALVAPFTARSTGAGYGSAVGEEGRWELWLPLWSGWASHAEIATLVRESRAQVASGSRHRQAATGLDFARAAGELGLARGIDAFERYAILERAGQSSLAVPAGRITVAPRPAAAALASIDQWLNRLLRFSGSDSCPRAARIAIRGLEERAFTLASRGDPEDAHGVLEGIGAAEHALARSARGALAAGLQPMRGVPAGPWVEAAHDGSPEFAVAVALASLHDRERRSPALRDYLHGTVDGGTAFDEKRRHAVTGGNPAQVLAQIHARRHLDASRDGSAAAGEPNLSFDFGTWCDLGAMQQFAAGNLDDERVLSLVRGLAVLDHGRSAPVRRRQWGGLAAPTFDVLALAWARNLTNVDQPSLGPRPGWAARLAAGATAGVVRDALLRLRMARMPVIPSAADLLASPPPGPRLGAGLLVRLGPADTAALARKLTLHEDNDHEENR
jgi:CRISPR-associated protein Csx17